MKETLNIVLYPSFLVLLKYTLALQNFLTLEITSSAISL